MSFFYIEKKRPFQKVIYNYKTSGENLQDLELAEEFF